jgi:hypothetical protein
MRTVSVVVCLLFAGLFSITQNKKETNPMSQPKDAIRFVKSEKTTTLWISRSFRLCGKCGTNLSTLQIRQRARRWR